MIRCTTLFVLALALCGVSCEQKTLLPDQPIVVVKDTVDVNPRPVYSDYVQSYLAVDDSVVALVDVTVIDGTGAAARFGQTILLEGHRIIALGDGDAITIPSQATVLNLKGKTVIPGLVGMHNHTHMPGVPILEYTAPRLYLASGVTTIQTTGSAAPYAEMNMARAIARGHTPGPDIVHTGPYFSGEGGSPAMIHPEDTVHIERVMRAWIAEGVTWFKAYRHIAPTHLQTVIDVAHAHGAKVAGHLCSVTYAEAAAMGIDVIEHGFIHSFDHASDKETGVCSGSRSFRDDLAIESDTVKRVHQTLMDHGVALSSTLAIFEAQVPGRGVADERTLAAMSPEFVEAYQARQKRMAAAGKTWYFKEAWLKKSMAYDYAFFKAGGLLTAGLDPGLHNLPGYGDQRNFELLVEAGFSPVEAIQVMTANGAILLEKPDIGTLAVGQRANLVVLHGDIEANASAIRNVELVFKDGYGFDPAKLIADVQGLVGYR